LVVIGGGLLALLPAVIRGIPHNYDLQHHYHFALPFYEALIGGNLFPSWLAESNYGFGDPVFRFYPPAFYYLLAIGRAITGDWYVATLLVLSAVSIAGSIGAYFWARCFVTRNNAALAGCFYAFMPYHVSEIYQAALLAEFAAGAALLFSFAYLRKVCDEGKTLHLAGLAFSYSLLLLTHLPLAVMGSLTLLVYGCCSIERRKFSSTLLKLSAALGLAIAGTAFYWSRMLFELSWIRSDSSHPNPLLDYRLNFLLASFSPEQNLSLWWMNMLMLATLVMLLPALVLLRRQAPDRRITFALFVILCFAIFMATPLSKFVWHLLPPLQRIQHPFRWLAVISSVVPLLLAISASFWLRQFRSRLRPLALLAVGALAISLAFTAGQTIRDANYLSRSDFEELLRPLKEAPSINAWLPVWAESASRGGPADDRCVPPAVPSSLVEAGNRAVSVEKWEGEERRFVVSEGSEPFARVRTFYYPHWVATSGGALLRTAPDNNGALLVSLPETTTTVHLQFREPRRVKLATAISAFAWLGMVVLGLSRPWGTRK
jgi:hypothetical protein